MKADDTSAGLAINATIDVRGMQCPLPVLKARKRLKMMDYGEILEVLVTDPAAVIDFPHYCNGAGHELIECRESEGELTFIIRKSHA